MLIDSHCHLNFKELQENLSDIIKRAKASNVEIMQTVCTHLGEFPDILKIAEDNKEVYCSVGVHPNDALREDCASVEELVLCSKNAKVIGIGETGLDFYKKDQDIDDIYKRQLPSFENHIEACRKTKLPIIIHSRYADKKMIEVLESEMKNGDFTGVMHCFSSGKDLCHKALDLGLYISISGMITFKNAQELRDIVKNVPYDRLLLETDAPFLSPDPHRKKSNEPAFVKYAAESLADLLGIKYEELSEITTNNFFNLFAKCVRL